MIRVGTETPRVLSATNEFTKQFRRGFSTADYANDTAGISDDAHAVYIGDSSHGGFMFSAIFGMADDMTTGCTSFVGVKAEAIEFGLPTTGAQNLIGFGNDAGEGNLQFIWAGTTHHRTDLGANFPSHGNGAALYHVVLYAPRNPALEGFKLGWYIKRVGTNYTASGVVMTTVGVDLPSLSTLLYPAISRSNGANTASAIIDIGPMTIHSSFGVDKAPVLGLMSGTGGP